MLTARQAAETAKTLKSEMRMLADAGMNTNRLDCSKHGYRLRQVEDMARELAQWANSCRYIAGDIPA